MPIIHFRNTILSHSDLVLSIFDNKYCVLEKKLRFNGVFFVSDEDSKNILGM